ncbi:MAG: hypothetical protein M1813_009401 [Trichoglossum hirsutum]|nr:MAG: hypothetical protein M1813_009401 [Trichoglossum hirsutum]
MVSEDAAEEPLMRGDNQDADDGEHRLDEPSTAMPRRESELHSPGVWMWMLAFSAGISGLLFGYDTGVISATLVSIDNELSHRKLTTRDKSFITASTSLFALMASPAAGWAADRYGRRRVLLAADVLFIAGAVWQAVSGTVPSMVAGRSVVGVAVGAASLVVPLYISELAPAGHRGRLIIIQILMITLGQVVAYVTGWGLSNAGGGWRWMVGLGALPAGVQGAMVLAVLPESPRWLVRIGRGPEAKRVLARAFGGDSRVVVEEVVRGVEREIREEGSGGDWAELWTSEGNRRALAVACLLQGLQQLCGFNSLMYFSATLFSLLSFRSPTLPALSVALTNFLFTFLAFLLIDRFGRRRLLLYTLPLMAFALAVCAAAFGFLDLAGPESPRARSDPNPTANPLWPAYLVLATLTLYTAAYAAALGCIPWFQSELFPLRVRATGSSISTATNWAANTAVGVSFLPMLDLLGARATFAGYAVVCLLGWVGVWWGVREMGGVGLEDVGGVWSGKGGE